MIASLGITLTVVVRPVDHMRVKIAVAEKFGVVIAHVLPECVEIDGLDIVADLRDGKDLLRRLVLEFRAQERVVFFRPAKPARDDGAIHISRVRLVF